MCEGGVGVCVCVRVPICVNGEQIEEVCSFEYLGSILESTCSVDREVDSRLQKAGTVYQM